MGLNAIALFVASVLLIKILAKTTIGTGETLPAPTIGFTRTFSHLGRESLNGTLLFAIVTVLLWLAVAVLMYRQLGFLKFNNPVNHTSLVNCE